MTRSSNLPLLLLLTTIASTMAASDVLVFKDADFKDSIKQHPIILVEFYAPWCGHCKALAPEYEIAATKLAKHDPPIPLAKVDCIAETQTCSDQGVSGYPTLKLFKNGVLFKDYDGERRADGIVKYMISKAGPSSQNLADQTQFDKFVGGAGDQPVVVGFFGGETSTLKDKFQKAADALFEDFRFGYTSDAAVIAAAEGAPKPDTVLIYQPRRMRSKFEPGFIAYDAASSGDDLQTWIKTRVFGLAGVRTSTNAKYFSGRPLIIAYFDVDYEVNPKQTNYWRNRFVKVLRKARDAGKEFTAAIASSKTESHELSEFGVTEPDTTRVHVVARDSKGGKFVMPGEFNMAAFEKFLDELLAGKLTPYLKSEAPPAEPQTEPVKVAVAKNFDAVVNDPAKDVLIEFYAPWCGHCKSLEPKYKELAEKLKNEPEITIAKMDATANDVPPEYSVSGFPTIYFAPKNGKKSPQQYQSGREVNDFIKFLAKESTNPLKGFDRSGAPTGKSEL